MTISSQICKRIYQADGENRRWAVDFPYLSAAQLKVYCTDRSGAETDVSSHCVLDEIEQEIIYPTPESEQEPLPTGYTLTIVRNTTPTQTVHFTQQGVLDAAEIEKGLDKLTLQLQELGDQVKRSVKYPISSNKEGTDAQAFLTEIQAAQAITLSGALAQVQVIKDSLAQTVQEETIARQEADSALQNILQGKQDALTTAQLVCVNSGITSEKTEQIQHNQEEIAAIDAELKQMRPWQKPADWIDIRSGALDESVYFLVGHSLDYASYPKWSISAAVSNAGTYDIFVDGVKVATSASGATTTLDWQTLALTSGFDATYPTVLHTHIVRVAPSLSTNKLTGIRHQPISGQTFQGTLWVHFTTSNFLDLFAFASNGNGTVKLSLLQAITSNNDELNIKMAPTAGGSGITYFIKNAENLKKLPTLVGNDPARASYVYYALASNSPYLKKLKLKQIKADYTFLKNSNFEEIDTDIPMIMDTSANNDGGLVEYRSIKKLPVSTFVGADRKSFYMTQMEKLEPTVLDFSLASEITYINVGGTADHAPRGIKGLTVSSEAPFSNATSPQINVAYTGLDRGALVALFSSLPTVTESQVCNVTGALGAANLTTEDLAIATTKGWTITR